MDYDFIGKDLIVSLTLGIGDLTGKGKSANLAKIKSIRGDGTNSILCQ
jgi:hypothetical protein